MVAGRQPTAETYGNVDTICIYISINICKYIEINIEVIEPNAHPFTGYNSPTMRSKATESTLSTYSKYKYTYTFRLYL